MEHVEGMTLQEAAGRLRCSYRTVLRLKKLYRETRGDDGLETASVGRGQRGPYVVSEEALENFLERRRLVQVFGARGCAGLRLEPIHAEL